MRYWRRAGTPSGPHTSTPGYRSLTSQLYFDEDPYLLSDVASAVKESLILKLAQHSDPDELKARGLDAAYCTVSYAFRLATA